MNSQDIKTYSQLIQHDVFQNLSYQEYQTLGKKHARIPPQTYVFHEGDRGNAIYFLLQGHIQLKKGPHLLDTVASGSLFGETECLDQKNRPYTAQALDAVELLEITLPSNPSIQSHRLIHSLARYCFKKIDSSNNTYLKNLEKKLIEIEHQNIFGSFYVYFLVIYSMYSIIESVVTPAIYTSPLSSFALGCVLFIPTLIFVTYRKLCWETFGVTTKKLWSSLALNVGVFLNIGIFSLAFSQYFAQNPLFTHPPNFWNPALLFHTFCLELVLRGVLVEMLQRFFPKSQAFFVILSIALLLFPMHLFHGVTVAILRFYFNILYGMVYVQQKNIFGVTVLHYCIRIFYGVTF